MKDPLRQSVVDLLGTGALPREEIARHVNELRLVPGGITSARHKVDELLQRDTVFSQTSSGFVHVPTLVEGTVWTVWVDAADAAEGFVRTDPQLAPLTWWLVHGGVQLVDAAGAVVGPLETDGIILDGGDIDVVFGPDGWLDGVAGGFAAVEVVGGALRWSQVASPPALDARQVEAIRTGYARATEEHDAILFDSRSERLTYAIGDGPMYEALLADRDAFVEVPMAPLADLYTAAGLEQRGAILAETGFDWDVLRSSQDRNRLALVYDLTAGQVDQLALLVGACMSFVDQGEPGLGDDVVERESAAGLLAAMLEDGSVALGFVGECDRRQLSVADLGRFADALVDLLGGETSDGVGWLRAECLDLRGDAVVADALLRRLATSRCEHEPLLVAAAGFAADRGDAATAYRLLRQAGVLDRQDDDEEMHFGGPDDVELLVQEVEGFALNRPRANVGRNDPCPCGSGRKYKACHLGREQHPLEDRAGWLFGKANRFARTRDRQQLEELADLIAEHMPRVRPQLAGSGFVADLALHEGGLFEAFLASRAVLLPDDEALLAAQWSLVDRGVFEVRRVGGDRLELHDIGSGDDISVVNLTPGADTRPGTVFVGRPLPVGDTYRAFGGFVTLPRAMVSDMLDAIEEGDAEEIAMLIADTMRPPRLQNTDGEDLALHTITWSVADAGAVGDALVAAGFETAGESRWSLSRGATVVATVTLEGDQVVGEANSEPRAGALMQRVQQALPEAVLLESDVTSMDEAMERHDAGAAASTEPLSLDDPAVRAALAGFMAEQERKWLDEHVPALGGRTPREAVKDPIGREELLHLLASFPDTDPVDFTQMSAVRLRGALGL